MLAGAGSTAFALSEVRGREKPLPFPENQHSLETLTRSVRAVNQFKGRVITMPSKAAFAMVGSFHPEGTTREQVFGKISTLDRREVFKGDSVYHWTGIDVLETRVLLFEGESLTMVEADPETLKEVTRRSVLWDRIAPPRDRGGEATAPETAALRVMFKQRFSATSGVKVAGIAPLPDTWRASPLRQYVVATRIRGFPLLIMECDKSDLSVCRITRQCHLEGSGDLKPEAITGIAVSSKRRLILIGDADGHRLVGFKFHSCYHITRRDTYPLPVRLKELTNVAVDADDRLWVTTDAADDYHNASLFYWEGAGW